MLRALRLPQTAGLEWEHPGASGSTRYSLGHRQMKGRDVFWNVPAESLELRFAPERLRLCPSLRETVRVASR